MAFDRFIKISLEAQYLYHIEQFNFLVKMLYPKQYTVNKYKILLEKTPFTKEEKKLILETADSFVLLNKQYRDQNKWGELYVIKEDMSNAIYMLQNELTITQKILLSPVLQWYLQQIYYLYQYDLFTLRELYLRMGKSKTAVYDVLQELTQRKFVTIVMVKKQAFVYQLTGRK